MYVSFQGMMQDDKVIYKGHISDHIDVAINWIVSLHFVF